MSETGGHRTDHSFGARALMREAQSRRSFVFAAKVALWLLIALLIAGMAFAIAGAIGNLLA